MFLRLCTGMLLLASGAIWADDATDRAKLTGTWEIQNGTGKEAGSSWTLEDKGDTMHVAYSEGSQKMAEFDCNTKGADCKVKDGGHSATVSFYFNGAKLVELETQGSNSVVKRRFGVVGQGDEMEVEVMPIVPSGQAETLHFKRAHLASAKQP